MASSVPAGRSGSGDESPDGSKPASPKMISKRSKKTDTPLRRLFLAGALAALLWPGGAGAQAIERETRDELRVCADAGLLPYSNRAGKGFENKLAGRLADDLGVPLSYTWWPQTMGFVRNTLRARTCDVIMGINEGNELVLNTNPYYRSVYTLVYRRGLGLDIERVAEPLVRNMRIGVVETTPAVSLLQAYGHQNYQPYQLTTDTRAHQPARQAVADAAAGVVDAAIVWGPIAGYFAARQDVEMVVVPLVDEPAPVRLDFHITMGVRHGELEWKHRLNDFIRDNRDAIRDLLMCYHVPLLDRDGKLIVAASEEAAQ